MKGPAVRMTNIRLNSCRHSRAGLCGWGSHQVYGLWEWITPDMPAISWGDGSFMVFQIRLGLFSDLKLQRLQLKWPGTDLIASLAVSQGGYRSFVGVTCSKWVIWREEKQLGQDAAKGVSLAGLLPAWTQVFLSFWGSFLLMWWLLNQTSPLLHDGLTIL